MKLFAPNLIVCLLACFLAQSGREASKAEVVNDKEIQLGSFSISLAVKDLQKSMDFYQKLGFRQAGGNSKQRWVILQNETSTIGLFQGMFEKNTLTFNPGWDRDRNVLKEFDDVRDVQRVLLERGIDLSTKTDQSGEGPAFIAFEDPDGNPILIDQHVSKSGKR